MGVVMSPERLATTHSMLECCCDVLAYMYADPVYKVFVAGLVSVFIYFLKLCSFVLSSKSSFGFW